MQKIRKILRAVSEKTALSTNPPTNQPTNQPTITNNNDFIGTDWRRSNKFNFLTFTSLCKLKFVGIP